MANKYVGVILLYVAVLANEPEFHLLIDSLRSSELGQLSQYPGRENHFDPRFWFSEHMPDIDNTGDPEGIS